MGDYINTVWKDHIKDQNGNVIQQGTPVSANNLNNMEKQIVVLSAKENALSELVKETVPSGFSTLSDLDYTFMATNPNQIKLTSETVAYVNGYKTVIPAGTIITLNAPPSTGTRDDLVFLECWKQADTNGVVSWNYRLRVVDGVDFKSYPQGFHTDIYDLVDASYSNVTPQGANISTLLPDVSTTELKFISHFTPSIVRPASSMINKICIGDTGVYTAGTGSTLSKTTLKTADGYVYAIPMFKVHRRNSGGYSVSNGNGSKVYSKITGTYSFGRTANISEILQLTFNDVDYANIEVGSYLQASSYMHKVINKASNNVVTILIGGHSDTGISVAYIITSNRPDTLLANVIVDRDIIDLRHKVSLTGFNYQQLLEENFDKLLRGELQTSAKTNMLKTYHGIPKTPIDANHIFYASLDGTTTAEVGGSLNLGTGSFRPMPTGLGYVVGTSAVPNILPVNLLQEDQFTIDVEFYHISDGALFSLFDSNNRMLFMLFIDSTLKVIDIYKYSDPVNLTGWTSALSFPFVKDNGYHQLRLTNNNGIYKIYLDGVLKSTSNLDIFKGLQASKLGIGFGGKANGTIATAYYTSCPISDISISNIDRGAVFATLPQDFIDGYARISPAFNGQRQVFSDALTSQYTIEKVTASTGGRPKQFTVSQGTANQWTAGDTIKVTGLGGEIISGVIDTDTALAKIVSATGQTIIVDDISKFVVGDIFKPYNSILNSMGLSDRTVSAIDSINKMITFTGESLTQAQVDAGWNLLFETTASTSSPTVKANASGTAQAGASTTITLPTTFNPTDDAYNGLDVMITAGTGTGQRKTISDYVGSTKVATVSSAWTTIPDATSQFTIYNAPVTGTWSGLGTNASTFTLGTLYALNVQDIQLEYSLNQVAGQGGISEVLTTTLGGTANGKNLIVNPSVHIRDDFAGKVSGSTTVCPHIFSKSADGLYASSTLLTPSQFHEAGSAQSGGLSLLDGLLNLANCSTGGNIPQMLLQFNIIRMIEDKIGTIPAIDKVKWIKDNVSSIILSAYAYGSCPSGNKAVIGIYTTQWNASNSNVSATPVLTSVSIIETNSVSKISNTIQPDGMVNFLIYTDASDGVTPSQVNLDYPYLDIVLKTPTGYDVLAPENPRRDDGKANMLLVRKETKEIQCFMDASNTDGIVSYGDYVPKQGMLPPSSLTGGYSLVKPKAYLTTLTTRSSNMVFNPNTNFGLLDEYSVIDSTISTVLTDGSQLRTDATKMCSMTKETKIVGFHSNMSGIDMGMITSLSASLSNIFTINSQSIVKYIDLVGFSLLSNYVTLMTFLVKDKNGILFLVVSAYNKKILGNVSYHSLAGEDGRILAFQLTNRPLIKGGI
jgi:hypothetical protein